MEVCLDHGCALLAWLPYLISYSSWTYLGSGLVTGLSDCHHACPALLAQACGFVPLPVRFLWLCFALVCAPGYLCLAEPPSPAAPCPLGWAWSAGLVQQEPWAALSSRRWWSSLCQSASSHWLGKSQHHSTACQNSSQRRIQEHGAPAEIYIFKG